MKEVTSSLSRLFGRSWSFAIVCVILGSVFGPLRSEVGRALASVLCIALLVQCWYAQRAYVRSRSRFVLVTLALMLPAMAAAWLGINVIRFYSYNGQFENATYSNVIRLQSLLESCVMVVAGVVVLWSIIEGVRALAKRLRLRLKFGLRQS